MSSHRNYKDIENTQREDTECLSPVLNTKLVPAENDSILMNLELGGQAELSQIDDKTKGDDIKNRDHISILYMVAKVEKEL